MDAVVSTDTWITLPGGAAKRVEPSGPIVQWRDPVGFEWNTYRLPIFDLPVAFEGFRIVHVSDIHARPAWLRAYDDLADRLAQDPPELVCFTGDLVEHKQWPGHAVGIGMRLSAMWTSRLGSLAIRGNHDLNLPLDRFAAHTLRFIEGQRVLFERDGQTLEVVGLPGTERSDLTQAFLKSIPARRPNVPRVVMSHFPDHIRRCRSLKADLFLAGHTHGGQCSLPGLRPIIRHDSLPWQFTRGVHRWGGQWLVANRGFGFSSLPLRVLCPAEVIEVILTANNYG